MKGFVREEMILGYKTFLVHNGSVESGELDDFYICPILQGYPLKRVVSRKDGSITVYEVTSVEPGEPLPNLFESLPNYPVINVAR